MPAAVTRRSAAAPAFAPPGAMNAWSLAVSLVTVAAVLYLVVADPTVTVPAKWLRRREPLHLSVRCDPALPLTTRTHGRLCGYDMLMKTAVDFRARRCKWGKWGSLSKHTPLLL